MKKLFFGAMCFALIGVGLTGCKKEQKLKPANITNVDNQFNISSDGRMLIFKTTKDYEKIVVDPAKELRSDFFTKVGQMKHTTYAEKVQMLKIENDTLIGDEFMAQILNEDWIVQIGDYLYRVNKPEEKVFVLPAINISEYSDLVNENKSNPNIRKFSTDDNVIELAEAGEAGEKGIFCSEGGVGKRSVTTDQSSMPTSQKGVHTELRHSSWGVYFDLVMESWSDYPMGCFAFEFPADANLRKYKRRCESVENVFIDPNDNNIGWVSPMSWTYTKFKIRENISNFSKYYIRGRCRYYHNDMYFSQKVLYSISDWIEIRVNF